MKTPPSVRYLRDTSRAEAVWAYTPAYVANGMINLSTMFIGEGLASHWTTSGSEENPRLVTFEAVPPMPKAGTGVARSQPRPPQTSREHLPELLLTSLRHVT